MIYPVSVARSNHIVKVHAVHNLHFKVALASCGPNTER